MNVLNWFRPRKEETPADDVKEFAVEKLAVEPSEREEKHLQHKIKKKRGRPRKSIQPLTNAQRCKNWRANKKHIGFYVTPEQYEVLVQYLNGFNKQDKQYKSVDAMCRDLVTALVSLKDEYIK